MAQKNKWINLQHIHCEGYLFTADLIDLISKDSAPAQGKDGYGLPSTISIMDEIGQSYKKAIGLYSDYQLKLKRSNADTLAVTRDFICRFLSNCLGWNIENVTKLDAGGKGFPIRRQAYGRIPIAVVSGENSLDRADSYFSITNGLKNVSPFSMMQQYLSAAGDSRWGIVASGKMIRLLRSSTSLSKPEYLEFDLGAILSDDFYNEYAVLWKILHVSRIRDTSDGTDLEIWEEWKNTSISNGERARDRLRVGVERAIVIFANGFLSNRANKQLQEEIFSGRLSATEYFHELLRLCYRILFLSVIEERYSENGIRLVFDPDSGQMPHDIYEKGYSLARLRGMMRKKSFRSVYHYDLWEAMKITFEALDRGESLLGLPSLGGLFADSQCSHCNGLRLSNRDFLEAITELRWTEHDGALYWIDFRNLGTVELGSVYESLLELVPMIDGQTRQFRFIAGSDDETNSGNKRKTTGSYYTPDFLVKQLIRTALIPVVEERLNNNPDTDPEEVLLSMTVVDPACGSGHFLIEAATVIATYLARYREDGNSASGFRRAYRDVISNCLYGVDLNPMAVELTKMALWLEGYQPGKPLSFLDSKIKCGNSLIGVFDLSILNKGIPGDAYTPIGSDSKEFCKALKKANTTNLKNLKASATSLDADVINIKESIEEVNSLEEDSTDDVKAKKARYERHIRELNESRIKKAADYYTSAFFYDKADATLPVPTTDGLNRIITPGMQLKEDDLSVLERVNHYTSSNHFFHWKLEFPEVFSKGGFDCVLGNPPWDKVKLNDVEFFSSRISSIANAQNASQRKKLITALKTGTDYEKEVFAEYQETLKGYTSQSTFLHVAECDRGQYPLSGKGDVNLYALFTELASKIKSETGAVGIIVPTGICTDDSTKYLFGSFVDKRIVQSIYDFENGNTEIEEGKTRGTKTRIFPAVHASYKFSLLTLRKTENTDFCFFLHSVKDLEDKRRHYPLTSDDIRMINPNTKTLPLIRSEKDYQVLKKIYTNSQVLWDENRSDGNTFGLSFMRMFDMSNDSGLFLSSPGPDRLPLYEGKMINIYDHRFNSYDGDTDSKGNPITTLVSDEKKHDPSYEITPQYWLPEREVIYRYSNADKKTKDIWYEKTYSKTSDDKIQGILDFGNDPETMSFDQLDKIVRDAVPKWCLGFRDIARATDRRTFVSSVFPIAGVGNNVNLLCNLTNNNLFSLLGNTSSFIFDYAVRNKVGGTHVNQFYAKQLPIISTNQYSDDEQRFVISNVTKLVATSDKIAKALDCEVHIYDEDERESIKSRLDAFYAMKYGLTRDEYEFILDPEAVMGKGYPTQTFPAIKADDIAKYGTYRTKDMCLKAYDELMENGLWQD